MSKPYVAYYRVSTSRQGRSGLGLEAQREAVAQFLRTSDVNLIAEFTEVESGTRTGRPQLQAALTHCRRRKRRSRSAVLIGSRGMPRFYFNSETRTSISQPPTCPTPTGSRWAF